MGRAEEAGFPHGTETLASSPQPSRRRTKGSGVGRRKHTSIYTHRRKLLHLVDKAEVSPFQCVMPPSRTTQQSSPAATGKGQLGRKGATDESFRTKALSSKGRKRLEEAAFLVSNRPSDS